MAVMDTARRDHAQALLGRLIGDRPTVSLGYATRGLIRADRAAQRRRGDPALRLDGRIRPATVARLLIARGYRKIGLDGIGRFAEPLYARSAATPAPRNGVAHCAVAAEDGPLPWSSSAPSLLAAVPASAAAPVGGNGPSVAADLCGADA